MSRRSLLLQQVQEERASQRQEQFRRTRVALGVIGSSMLAGGAAAFFWASQATPAAYAGASASMTPAQQLARDKALLAQLSKNAAAEAGAARSLSAPAGTVPALPPLPAISVPAPHAVTGASGVP